MTFFSSLTGSFTSSTTGGLTGSAGFGVGATTICLLLHPETKNNPVTNESPAKPSNDSCVN
ncbi:MAG: hypothetical protein IPP34_20520 [Bacteroidetes bacterium]|nr:hypothetical protein [Bacteroidota bacterium]